MRKLWFGIFLSLFVAHLAAANSLVKKENYLNVPLEIVGLPDFPPFASYVPNGRKDAMIVSSAFLQPLGNVLDKYGIKHPQLAIQPGDMDVKMLLQRVRSGQSQIFIGAYADTKLFRGLEMISPAIISNPVHVITLRDNRDRYNNIELKNLRGVACRCEYFSDFVLRKFKEDDIELVDTPMEAYQKLIANEADYLLGSIYYNKIMMSRLGMADFFVYSQNPLYNIPFYIGISKLTPLMSEYVRVLQQEFRTPEFKKEVIEEVLRMINQERIENEGIVPPSFAEHESEESEDIEETVAEENLGGRIVEQKDHQDTLDEVVDDLLDGI